MEIIWWLFESIHRHFKWCDDACKRWKCNRWKTRKYISAHESLRNFWLFIENSFSFDLRCYFCCSSGKKFISIFHPFSFVVCKPTYTHIIYLTSSTDDIGLFLFIDWNRCERENRKVLNDDVAMSIEHQLFILIGTPNSNWISFRIDRNHIFYTHSSISVFRVKQIKTKQHSDEELKASMRHSAEDHPKQQRGKYTENLIKYEI